MPVAFQPPFVTMLVVLSAWVIHSLLGSWPTMVRLPVLGGALVMLGFSFMLWARLLFTSRNTTLFVGRPSSRLVCDGPFRFSRNPMYVGVLVFLVGLTLMGWDMAFLPGCTCNLPGSQLLSYSPRGAYVA